MVRPCVAMWRNCTGEPEVTFAPTTVGEHTATITLSYPNGCDDTYTFTVSGTAAA